MRAATHPARSRVLLHGLTVLALWAFGLLAHGAQAFPLEIRHAFGVTTIPAEPMRIVTLGWGGEDAVVALGKVPVAMTRYDQFADGMFPWIAERIGGAQPVLLEGELNYERIASLRPDLILGVYSGVNQLQWQRLSSIAPTVVYRSGPWMADWVEVTEMTGATLGQPQAAQDLIAQTRATLADLGARHPGLQGQTFTFGTYLPGGNGMIVYLPGDPRVSTLAAVGLHPTTVVQELGTAAPGKTSVSVSLERLGDLEADLLIMWYRQGARVEAEAQPAIRMMANVQTGRYLAVDDPVSVWVTSMPSVLSVPYGFPAFLDRLAKVAGAQ